MSNFWWMAAESRKYTIRLLGSFAILISIVGKLRCSVYVSGQWQQGAENYR